MCAAKCMNHMGTHLPLKSFPGRVPNTGLGQASIDSVAWMGSVSSRGESRPSVVYLVYIEV